MTENKEKKALPPAYIGCAGWSIPKEHAEHFPEAGSHLTRYAQRFSAVEINSSFYCSHRPATYAKWAASVPDHFRFAVKVPRQITHLRQLMDIEELLEGFLAEVGAMGEKLGPLLVQLPPSLVFDPAIASGFFAALRERFAGSVVCEPRHPSWFQSPAEQVLVEFEAARVAVDPVAPVSEAEQPGGWSGLVYYRLHGSPRIYYSAYEEHYLETLAGKLHIKAASAPVWCVFDNTALGAATANAQYVAERIPQSSLAGQEPEQ